MTMLLAPELLGRWVGWRLRVVMAVALAGCLIIFAFLRWLPAVSWAFWPLAVLALLLALVGAVVVMAKPIAVNGLYLLITLFQAGKLLLAAATLSPGWQQIVNLGPLAGTRINLLPAALDVLSAAAVVHALSLHPVRLRTTRRVAGAAWLLAALALLVIAQGMAQEIWQPWWTPTVALLTCCVGVIQMQAALRLGPQPVAAMGRQWLMVAAGATALAFAVQWLAAQGHLPQRVGATASWMWQITLALALLLIPFATRSRQLMREFALLAGVSAMAASLDLLFIAVFSLAPFTALAIVVFIALGLYAGARQWFFDRLMGSNVLTTERIFEQVYRAAREVQARPDQHVAQLAAVLRDLFEPLEVLRSNHSLTRAAVLGGGARLAVPLVTPQTDGTPAAVPLRAALELRYARHGQRIFTIEDARLADRVVEQLRRAVAYDLAVERGRDEERQRIAQDLHDDIGARLLTLMYQAPTPAMEDYVRHTLKDLKTLTRGLAASEHRLSHAVAEWKTDLGQRLSAAGVEMDWSAHFDTDGQLSMAQWSALTRVLRELVSNTIAHGHATLVSVHLLLDHQALRLVVRDNGLGKQPEQWAHGLGLGGVRKRMRLLGGEVAWRECQPSGIECDVFVPQLGLKP